MSALRVSGVGFALVVIAVAAVGAQGQGPAPGTDAPATPRAAAPVDLTGQWVAVITEDWRWRMVTPAKGDYASIPLTPAAMRVADAWSPSRDEAAGEQCRSYGAPALMRAPTRLRFTWLDDSTLRMESDYGMQTRLLHFSPRPAANPRPTWQGESTALWVTAPAGRGAGTAQRFGSLKTTTTRLRPGYLRKNGVPYSANTVLTEYWAVHRETDGSQYLVVTIRVDDPTNLQVPWVTAMHFRKETDTSKWDPTPCSPTW